MSAELHNILTTSLFTTMLSISNTRQYTNLAYFFLKKRKRSFVGLLSRSFIHDNLPFDKQVKICDLQGKT